MLPDVKSGAVQYFLQYSGLRMDRVEPFLFCATNTHHVQLTATSNLLLHVVSVHYSEMIVEVDSIALPFTH